jgi:hypothetical protein
MSRSATSCFRHRPLPGDHLHYGRCALAITLTQSMRHSYRWWVPMRGEERLGGNDISKLRPHKFKPKPSVHDFIRRRPIYKWGLPTVPLLSLRLSSSMFVLSSNPIDRFTRPHERWSTSSECPTLAMLSRCPPLAPTPASHRCTLLAQKNSQTLPPSPYRESSFE